MGGRSWGRPVGPDSQARVALESADPATETTYEVAFPFLVGDQSPDDIQVTGAGGVDDHRIRSDDGLPVSDLAISIPGEFDVERLIVRSRAERIVIHLPSPELLDRCGRALDGDAEAAAALLEAFASPIQLAFVCGSFLGLEDTVRLIEALARANRHAGSLLHSYRYAIVRGAVVSRTGLHVRSYRELVTLADGLDAIDEIGAVSVVEALGDVIATVHDSPRETERLLESLDVGFERLDDRSDGLFTACFLAHIACTEGVEAAQAFEVPRKLPPRGHYDRRKRAVFTAAYGDRGSTWRRLLNAARRQSDDEIGYVLAYTLYWTGEESRSDSRMPELLLRGAERVADHKRLDRIAIRARYKRLMAAGHRLRGTHCWGPSIENFEAARELAASHAFLPEWEPILASGIVQSRGLSNAGDHGAAVEVLDNTIDSFLGADPPTAVANRSVHHLKAQKSEIDSLRFRSEAPAIARNLLEEARDHYAALGYARSREKVERQLASLADAAAAEEAVTAPVEAAERPASAGEDGLDPGVGEATNDLEEESEVPAELDDDWYEHLEYPDESAVGQDYEDAFDDPYQV